MITRLRIKNFKSLVDTGDIAIRPLTFLMGPNSSGKSSILQSLLILRQTIDERDPAIPLVMHGLYVQGTYPDLITNHELNRHLHFGIQFSTQHFPYRSGLLASRPTVSPLVMELDTEFSWNKKTSQVLLHRSTLHVSSAQAQYKGLEINIERAIKTHKYKTIVSQDNKTKEVEATPYMFFSIMEHFMPTGWPPTWELGKIVENELNKLFYIGPLREWPRRLYVTKGTAPKDVGLRGEQSVDVLWVQSRKKSTKEKYIGEVNKWMKAFDIAAHVSLQRVGGNNYSVNLKDPHIGTEVNFADVGFGASQILPIIIEGVYADKGSILLIEQPEIHLHPKAQADLADLLVHIVKEGGKLLLVETHSEHLVTRVQRRIAEKQLSKDNVAIYYCKPTAEGTKIQEIPLNEQGQFEGEGLPEGFFETGYKESFAHYEAMAKGFNDK